MATVHTSAKTSWHEYDIELVDLYTQYRNYILNSKTDETWQGVSKKDFAERQEKMLQIILKALRIDFREYVQKSMKLIVPADFAHYIFLLSLKLILADKHRVGRILDYQKNNFNKDFPEKLDAFYKYVEFAIAEQFRNNSIQVDEEKLDRIFKWVERESDKEEEKFVEKYEDVVYSSTSEKPTANETVRNAPVAKGKKRKPRKAKPVKREIRFTKDFIKDVAPKLETYFDEGRRKTLDIVIRKDTKPSRRLVFNGNGAQLVEFFKRAKYHGKLVCHKNELLAIWIYSRFEYTDKNTGKPKRFTVEAILAILKNSTKEANRRILEDILPYVSPTKRK